MIDHDYDVMLVEQARELKEQDIADIITEMRENAMDVVVFEEIEAVWNAKKFPVDFV